MIVNIFISYAQRDESLLNELENHLALLRNQGIIVTSYKQNISAGVEWERAVDTYLESAQIILLLTSSYFFSSEYCYSVEMRRALEKHESGEAIVIPILLRPVDWEIAPLRKLQALPKNGKPITKWIGKYDRHDAFIDVVRSIRNIIKEIELKNTNLKAIFQPEHFLPLKEEYKKPQITSSDSVFMVNQHIHHPSEFFGMEYARMKLLDSVRHKRSIEIVGDLHSGKTWLLKYLLLTSQDSLGSAFHVVYLDAMMPTCITVKGFIAEILAQLNIFSVSDCDFNMLVQVLKDLKQKSQHIVLCIDEFEELIQARNEFTLQFFKYLRALAADELLTMVTASRTELSRLIPTMEEEKLPNKDKLLLPDLPSINIEHFLQSVGKIRADNEPYSDFVQDTLNKFVKLGEMYTKDELNVLFEVMVSDEINAEYAIAMEEDLNAPFNENRISFLMYLNIIFERILSGDALSDENETLQSSPLPNIFTGISLTGFSEKEARNFVQIKSKQANFTKTEQKRLLKYGQIALHGWSPFYLQLAGDMILMEKTFAIKIDSGYYRPHNPMYWKTFEERLIAQLRGIEGRYFNSRFLYWLK